MAERLTAKRETEIRSLVLHDYGLSHEIGQQLLDELDAVRRELKEARGYGEGLRKALGILRRSYAPGWFKLYGIEIDELLARPLPWASAGGGGEVKQ